MVAIVRRAVHRWSHRRLSATAELALTAPAQATWRPEARVGTTAPSEVVADRPTGRRASRSTSVASWWPDLTARPRAVAGPGFDHGRRAGACRRRRRRGRRDDRRRRGRPGDDARPDPRANRKPRSDAERPTRRRRSGEHGTCVVVTVVQVAGPAVGPPGRPRSRPAPRRPRSRRRGASRRPATSSRITPCSTSVPTVR